MQFIIKKVKINTNMPITKSGEKVLSSMESQYGTKKGKEVFYASITKGKKGSSKWHGRGGTGKLAKAKRTYAKKHKQSGKSLLKKAMKKYAK